MSNTDENKSSLSLLLQSKGLKAVHVDPQDPFLLDLIRETQQDQASTYDLKRIDEEVLGLVVQF